MKKRMGSLLLACLMCLCLLPATAQAAEWYQTDEVYEVKPFYIEYLVASAPASEIREMTIGGETVEVSVYPAGTLFEPLWPLSFGNVYEYVDGEMQMTMPNVELRSGLPAQGIYQVGVYSAYYGHEGDIWVTAEGSDSTEPEPEQEPEPEPEDPSTVAGFSDVSADAWYAGYVETVAEKGLFSGNEDGTFAPEANMTYAQFLVVLSQFSGDAIPGAEGAWYQGYVNWADEAGLIPAGMQQSFNPDAAITRQDMAALFGAFLENYEWSADAVNNGDAAFTDESSIAGYAADGVQTCYELGIMSGKDGNTFDPLGTATRAEVAVTMTQMARVMGR